MSNNPVVTLNTSEGTIKLELFASEAPETVRNFVDYVRSGFYDGLIFHRVINGFMIQSGGFTPDMEQKAAGEPIRNEAGNGVANTAGRIAMARTMDPHSASSQFFINVANNDFLNHRDESTQGWGYAAFGEVTEGMDVVDRIKQAQTGSRAGHQDVPTEDIVIHSASVESDGDN